MLKLKKLAQEAINIAFIPDTHTDDYEKFALKHVQQENIGFIIHVACRGSC